MKIMLFIIIKFTMSFIFELSNSINFSSGYDTSWIKAESYCKSKNKSHIQTLSIGDFGIDAKLPGLKIINKKNAVLWTGLRRQTYPEWNLWKGGKSNLTGSEILQ